MEIRFLRKHLKAIDFECNALIFKLGAVVPILSSATETGNKNHRETPRTPATKLSTTQQPDIITDGHETHTVRTKHLTKVPEMTQIAVSIRTSAQGLVYLEPSSSF